MDTLVLTQQALRLVSAARTSRGERRKSNEDSVFLATYQVDSGLSAGLYVVCDGLGGLEAGEIASQLAIETVTSELAGLFRPETSRAPQPSYSELSRHIQAATLQAHAQIRRYAELHWREGLELGTTMSLALIYGQRAHIANVGDSRVYGWRSGQLMQITDDHSLAAELAKAGHIDPGAIREHRASNILTRALGIHERVDIDFFEWALEPGDQLLLCSDGLWKVFPETAELADRLASTATPGVVCQQLVAEAERRDGSDNISAVLVRAERK
jgi:serine/threonine protein phosphatase PrpC